MVPLAHSPMEVGQGAPARRNRFPERCHLRLCRQLVSLLGVTADAGAHDIFPACHAPLVPRNHMVKIQVPVLKALTAILANMIITLQDILTAKFDLLPGQPVKDRKHNDRRLPETIGNRVYDRPPFRAILKAYPGFKIMGRKQVVLKSPLHLGMIKKQQAQRAQCRTDVHRLPEPVQHKYLVIQYIEHSP